MTIGTCDDVCETPMLVPLPSDIALRPVRNTHRSMYIDAGSGETKLIVYSANIQLRPIPDPVLGVADLTNYYGMDEISKLEPIATSTSLDELSKSMVETSYQSFVNDTFLGATEWYRRTDPCAPADPCIESFLRDLDIGGIQLVELSGTDEALYEFEAVQFALMRVKAAQERNLVVAPPLNDFVMYVSAGGGSLQFSHVSGKTCSIPIGVKKWTTRIAESENRASSVDELETHLICLAKQFEDNCPKVESGFIVAMGSMFYSSKAIHMSNQDDVFTMHPALDVVGAMGSTAMTFDVENATEKDIRGYVALRVNQVFLSKTCTDGVRIMFKRNWKVGSSTFRTTWTFGHFISKLRKQQLHVR